MLLNHTHMSEIQGHFQVCKHTAIVPDAGGPLVYGRQVRAMVFLLIVF